MLLTRDQIIAANDLKRETVAVPEWGGDVIVREMTAAERAECEAFYLKAKASGDMFEAARKLRQFVLSICLVDGDGRSLFSREQCEELASKNNRVVSALYAVADRLNVISQDAADQQAKK